MSSTGRAEVGARHPFPFSMAAGLLVGVYMHVFFGVYGWHSLVEGLKVLLS